MKVVLQVKTLFITIVGVVAVLAMYIGLYYYLTNNDSETEGGNSSIVTDNVYLTSYSDVGFLAESSIEGKFWRFETVRPVFRGYMVENEIAYIDAVIIIESGIEVPVGIYVSGELDEDFGDYEDIVWLRNEYDVEDFETYELFGAELTFEELQENWDIKKGDQFEVSILVAGPATEDLKEGCLLPEYIGFCRMSNVSRLSKWNILGVYQDGASIEPNGVPFVEIYPYFIGRTIE